MRPFLAVFIVIFCLICNVGTILAQGVYDLQLKVQVIDNYDGDTITVNIPNVPDIFGKNIPIRLRGIDTPEIKSKCLDNKVRALAAKYFVYYTIESGHEVVLKNITRGKYFRLVADVYVDGRNLNAQLLQNKLAVPYFGNTKSKGCRMLMFEKENADEEGST